MTAKLILAVILGLLGAFYVLAPHDVHVSTGLGFGLDHMYHVVLGVVLLVVAVLAYGKMPGMGKPKGKSRK